MSNEQPSQKSSSTRTLLVRLLGAGVGVGAVGCQPAPEVSPATLSLWDDVTRVCNFDLIFFVYVIFRYEVF